MRHLRRILIMAAAAALLVGSLPAVASAHRADRFSDSRLGIMCDMLTGEQGTAILFLEVSAQFGGSALVGYWEPGTSPEMDPPTLISNESEVIGTVEGSTVDAVMQLYTFMEPDPEDPEPDFYGEPAGEATMSATLTPNGEIQTEIQRSQDSNARFRVEITSQELAVAGDLALPGEVAFDLAACRGVRESFEGFATNPDTYIQRSESVSLSCSWTDEDRSVFLFAGAGSFGGFSELYVIDASGEYGGFTEASLTTDAFSAEYELFAFGGGEEEPVLAAVPGEPGEASGTASAVATLSPNGESGHFIDRLGSEMFKAFFDGYAVEGELALTTPAGSASLPMNEHCMAQSERVQSRSSSPNGPKGPTGRPLPNDLPENAIQIQVGDAVTVRSTAGTAPEPEAACIVTDPEFGDFEIPISHTGWWSFTGTGADVTVDTTGSDFDTVVGVYTLGQEGMEQVGCVDDVFSGEEGSLQAILTVGTEAGVTYYLQAGGFGGSTGRLELAVD